ncbi:methionyl-tRNA synthetase [Arboricoccus pini]|uniref:Methionine--tRNA ligase n=1 Tax=Arboricoccus pini TaxID=1963835 RepID=A0A212PX05_9PROT|nr:methionine--tRNA ligase [Arboricoccus pini]SNB51489.1 methionyl-tRNA synthetase [Arboricoccus pini]
MAERSAFYVTTPIYYVNDSPHIGHAYTTLACDALARFMRLDGRDVRFLTGTDEHGQKVQKAAEIKGVAPLIFTDEVSQRFRDLVVTMGNQVDDFIRTTEARHKAACVALWEKLVASGDIYLGKYAGWYAVRDEAFYAESELVDGKAPTGAPVEWVEEESYFFRLSAWGDRLLDFYAAHPDFVMPQSRYNEVLSFVKGGLQDLSVSRTTFDWGVPVPGDPKHVMYVWLDALTNYISALGWPDDKEGLYARYWPADFHVVGKDILRFHAVYWPAFLMSAGLPVPRHIFAHGWWTVEGQKMSKSLGNAIPPSALVDTYGLDQTRYFLLREVPFGNDGDFSHASMARRMNHDLANDFGNLAQRTLSMIQKNCGGAVPEPGPLTPEDEALLGAARDLLGRLRPLMAKLQPHRALEVIWEVVGAANRYVDAQAPWALRKTDPARMRTVLWVVAETIRHLAIVTAPFVPGSAGAMLDQLAIPLHQRAFDQIGPEIAGLVPGTMLPAPVPIFKKFDVPAEASVVDVVGPQT